MTQSSILNIIFIYWEKFISALISTVLMTAKSLIKSVSALSLVLFHSYPIINQCNIWTKGH